MGERLILAEDNALLREGLRAILAAGGFDVVATAEDTPSLLVAAREPGVDIVVTDVRMPPHEGADGLRAAAQLRRDNPRLPVLVLSQYVEQSYVSDLLEGASRAGFGYLLKDRVADVAEFLDSLRRVLAGGTAIDPLVVAQLLRARRDPLTRLTPREREVLALMAEGHSNGAIASRLVVSDAAVGKHVGNIFLKLDLPPDDDQHRRVRAVLAWLDRQG